MFDEYGAPILRGDIHRVQMDPAQARAYDLAIGALASLESAFVPEAKLTLIVRLPGEPEADIVVTNDDLEEIRDLIDRRMAAKEATNERRQTQNG